jgi:putative endonuclease
MDTETLAPGGPRGIIGLRAEEVAAAHLAGCGWRILARNLRLGRDEVDIVGLEPGEPPTLVIVEVRSRGGPRFGAPEESVDRAKVARLYAAGARLVRGGGLPDGLGHEHGSGRWRVDLVTVQPPAPGAAPRVARHLRGLMPP